MIEVKARTSVGQPDINTNNKHSNIREKIKLNIYDKNYNKRENRDEVECASDRVECI